MEGRTTVIAFDDYRSPPIPIDNGLDQGCNLSMFLYRYYNSGQIRASEGRKGELATNYADDAICAAAGRDLEEAGWRLEEMFHREDGPRDWANTHFSCYEYHKFACLAMTRRLVADKNRPGKMRKQKPVEIVLKGKPIKSVESHKFLGVIMDGELCFKKHATYALEKGTKLVNQIRWLTKNAGGMAGRLARRMYYSSVAPSMLYAADVWCPPAGRNMERRFRGMSGAIAKMASVQRKVAIQTTGALRTTLNDLLLVHADMLPIEQQIEKICLASALRMASLPKPHPLQKDAARAAAIKCQQRHPALINILMNMSKTIKSGVESIEVTKKDRNGNHQ